jgi:orotidine-5'-phosphate decarboxylase
MLARLDPRRCRVKVGKELFTRAGPELVRAAVDAGFDGLSGPQIPRHPEHRRRRL